MEVIRSKIKLLDKKNGTIEVFLSGMTLGYAHTIENALSKYMDTESSYSIVREQYIATVDDPKK